MKTISNIMVTVLAVGIFFSCNKHEKVPICHVPPGNPSNKTNIMVSSFAVAAHLAHGDYLGTCETKLDPCEECDKVRKTCLASAAGDKKLIARCEADYNKCVELVGPCDKVDPCEECEMARIKCLQSAAGDKKLLAACEADYVRCVELVGPCEKKDPCKECDSQRQNCIANAFGDKDLILQCESEYKKCRAVCDGETPPPAEEPAGGGK